MSHPYEQYIISKAKEYRDRKAHEPECEILNPPGPPTDSTGFVYDVYVIPHCNCWLIEKSHTVEEMLTILRKLSNTHNLHSLSCQRYKTEPITYRGKPEVLRFPCNCWLSVDMPATEKPCPACAKPLLYAPRAPEGTARIACSDPDCVNANGIDIWLSVDIYPRPLVEYGHTKPQQRKESPVTTPKPKILSDLNRAKTYASAFTAAQNEINDFLEPFVRKYGQLMLELNPNYDQRDLKATSFYEYDREFFSLEGYPIYEFSESYTPTLDLPFAFVEDPEGFREAKLREKADLEEKAQTKKKADAADRVVRLRAQLARAEAEAAAAEQTSDPIKATSSRNLADKLRSEYTEQG